MTWTFRSRTKKIKSAGDFAVDLRMDGWQRLAGQLNPVCKQSRQAKIQVTASKFFMEISTGRSIK